VALKHLELVVKILLDLNEETSIDIIFGKTLDK
jgi:hypothetical protein